MILARTILFLIGLSGALFISAWIPAICIILLSMRFASWEAMFLGLIVDMLWLGAGSGFHELPLFTLGAIAAVWLFEPIRTEFLLP